MKVIAVQTWGENFRVTSVAFTLGPVAGDRCWNSSTVGGRASQMGVTPDASDFCFNLWGRCLAADRHT